VWHGFPAQPVAMSPFMRATLASRQAHAQKSKD